MRNVWPRRLLWYLHACFRMICDKNDSLMANNVYHVFVVWLWLSNTNAVILPWLMLFLPFIHSYKYAPYSPACLNVTRIATLSSIYLFIHPFASLYLYPFTHPSILCCMLVLGLLLCSVWFYCCSALVQTNTDLLWQPALWSKGDSHGTTCIHLKRIWCMSILCLIYEYAIDFLDTMHVHHSCHCMFYVITIIMMCNLKPIIPFTISCLELQYKL